MTGQIKDGRQEPAPGSKRAIAMEQVKAYVLSHHYPVAKSKHAIAAALGMSINRVQEALIDLDTFDGMTRSIPSPQNGYKVGPGWNKQAKQGEATQARHNSTRLTRQATRLENDVAEENDPAVAALMQMTIAQERLTANAIKAVGEILDSRT